MKLNYHPPHLILIHFPAALFPMDWVCSAIGLYRHDQTFATAAFYALTGGVVLGWVAVILGFIDLARISPEKEAARQTALIHGLINTCMLIGYSVIFYLQWHGSGIAFATMPVLILKSILLLTLIIGNYLGAQLVLKHKIGTIETP